jgi:serine protease Do
MRFSRLLLGGAVLALASWVAPSSAPAQNTLSALQTDVDQIVQRSRPSVVTVLALRVEVSAHEPGARPHPRTRTRVGSGVVIEDGIVLTTASVVLGAERLVVRTANGLQAEGRITGVDPIFNVATIRVPSLRLPALSFAQRRSQVGDWVISLGTSYGAQPTQSVGTVAYRFVEPGQSLLQLTNTVYAGNSGAAALNARGELVGIVQGELGTPDIGIDGGEGARRPGSSSFVLPVESLRPVVDALKREGRVRHGYMGVTTRAASVESPSSGERVPIGALVEAVVENSPAEVAGLKRGDLIVAFARERVEYPIQLARWVAASRPGSAVDLVWVRDDAEQQGRAVLGESPSVVPPWIATTPAAQGGPPLSAERITDLEREVRRLSEELQRLRGRSNR